MHVPRPAVPVPEPASAIETIELPADVIERMKSAAQHEQPGAHPAFALPHLVRRLLDRLIANEDPSGDSNR